MEATGTFGFTGDSGSGILEAGVELSKGGRLETSNLCEFGRNKYYYSSWSYVAGAGDAAVRRWK